jgi:hypothetical protein
LYGILPFENLVPMYKATKIVERLAKFTNPDQHSLGFIAPSFLDNQWCRNFPKIITTSKPIAGMGTLIRLSN